MHIFLVPLVQAAAGSQPVHVVWDARTDSFWLDKFPATIGPLSVHNYDADDPDDRAFLLGGYDSYIRQFDDSAKDDDGTVINSYIDFTPIIVADAANMKMSNIRCVLDNASDAVRLEVYAEKDVQTLNASTTPRFTKTLAAGRNQPIIQRAVGNALNIRLENDAATAKQWALESLSAMLWQGGRQRHGVL